MRLNFASLGLLALATSAAADEVTVLDRYIWDGASRDRHFGVWTTGYGHYDFNGNDGCGGRTAVPGLREYCFGWNAGRAHFYFDDPPKRCLFKWKSTRVLECLRDSNHYMARWKEVACTW